MPENPQPTPDPAPVKQTVSKAAAGVGSPRLVTVKNVGASVIDLDDGRSLAPGETAELVNPKHPHNDRLVLAGLLTETRPAKEK